MSPDSTPSTPVAPAATALAEKIRLRQATVAVVGLGYVGLPLARAMHDAGFAVIGFDVDDSKIQSLAQGESYLQHLGAELVEGLHQSERFEPTSDPTALARADAILLCVPTPLGPHKEPDMSYVEQSTELVAKHLRKGQLISLESTTWPGTTRKLCLPILEQSGLHGGRDFWLAYSPEREDPGRKDHDTQSIPKLVGGIDETSTSLAVDLYSAAIAQVVPVESAEIAESAKLLENIYRAVNIALVNELKPVLSAMDIDIWKVIDAAATKPFGFQPFYPGPGLGGHCIPIDPFYLTWKAKEHGLSTHFIELAGEINSNMPRYVVRRVTEALNDQGKPLRGSRILVIGVAYKPDVDDVRETPAAEILTQLIDQGSQVAYHDPHVAELSGMRKYSLSLKSRPLTEERLQSADCVLICTKHSSIDWAFIGKHAGLIVDTRNAMQNVPCTTASVVHA